MAAQGAEYVWKIDKSYQKMHENFASMKATKSHDATDELECTDSSSPNAKSWQEPDHLSCTHHKHDVANSKAESDQAPNQKLYPDERETFEKLRSCGSSGTEELSVDGVNRGKVLISEAGKLPSSQYKGVVPQPNGRWGAQIYEKHQRVWLGTFNSEEDAAHAYDRAAMKFRGLDSMTNFRPVHESDPEATFLKAHSKEQIVDMLRRHTYNEELDQRKRFTNLVRPAAFPVAESSAAPRSCPGRDEITNLRRFQLREHLFDKAVTPSDVGKLNRLVIPKQHAERCFPLDLIAKDKGPLLSFEDVDGKVWRFRYSYWNSSQSYVLTKGWSRFVKEKKLDAGDIVSFERGPCQELYINWHHRPPPGRTVGCPISEKSCLRTPLEMLQLSRLASLQMNAINFSQVLNSKKNTQIPRPFPLDSVYDLTSVQTPLHFTSGHSSSKAITNFCNASVSQAGHFVQSLQFSDFNSESQSTETKCVGSTFRCLEFLKQKAEVSGRIKVLGFDLKGSNSEKLKSENIDPQPALRTKAMNWSSYPLHSCENNSNSIKISAHTSHNMFATGTSSNFCMNAGLNQLLLFPETDVDLSSSSQRNGGSISKKRRLNLDNLKLNIDEASEEASIVLSLGRPNQILSLVPTLLS